MSIVTNRDPVFESIVSFFKTLGQQMSQAAEKNVWVQTMQIDNDVYEISWGW